MGNFKRTVVEPGLKFKWRAQGFADCDCDVEGLDEFLMAFGVFGLDGGFEKFVSFGVENATEA